MQNSRFFSSFFNVFSSKFYPFLIVFKVFQGLAGNLGQNSPPLFSLTVLATAPCPIPITAGVRSISYSPKRLKQLEIPTEISDMVMSRSPRRGSRVLPLLHCSLPLALQYQTGEQGANALAPHPDAPVHQTGEQGAAPHPASSLPIPRPGVSPLPEFLTSPFQILPPES